MHKIPTIVLIIPLPIEFLKKFESDISSCSCTIISLIILLKNKLKLENIVINRIIKKIQYLLALKKYKLLTFIKFFY